MKNRTSQGSDFQGQSNNNTSQCINSRHQGRFGSFKSAWHSWIPQNLCRSWGNWQKRTGAVVWGSSLICWSGTAVKATVAMRLGYTITNHKANIRVCSGSTDHLLPQIHSRFIHQQEGWFWWCSQGPILQHYQECTTTLTNEMYYDMLQNELKSAICTEWQGTLSEVVLILHENARPHTAVHTRETFWELRLKFYSLDHAPLDFHLFGLLKGVIRGSQFSDDSEVKEALCDSSHSARTVSLMASGSSWTARQSVLRSSIHMLLYCHRTEELKLFTVIRRMLDQSYWGARLTKWVHYM